MTDRIGQQFGNYRLITLLGHGGFAEVYLGQHVRLPLQAAIKVLHTHLTGSEVEHFQHEAQTIARLAHPSVVRVLDYDVQEGVPFLVMDYAPNGSLRQRYPKGSLVPLPIIISSVKQVADALQYAHEQKFIHRDVKPENMLLSRRQEVLLSDFGIATIAHNTSSLNASAEGTSGTLAYMAPEQIEGHPRPASDQYALGVVVYEWLCGERPFEGSAREVMAQHLSVPPLPLHERVSKISDEIEQVVLKALAKDTKHRFASVRDFALALEEASRTEFSSGYPHLAFSLESPTDNRHASKQNLPVSLTPLLGREQDVATVCSLLRRPEVRLVTLTGTGGVGKTRLALQVATEVLADFRDGVFLVSLAPISDPELVVPAIAQVLDVIESGARPLQDLLTAFLRDKHLLLCLDNFEQILPAAPHLTDLLARCPHLNMLVTSRAVLHIQGEHEFSVQSLTVPDLTQLPPADTLPQYAAVALFLQRAEAVQPTFQMTSSNARTIAEICVHLDGLPLAIELAAARIKLLSPQALLARLSQRFAILTSGARDAPVRQQTLRNTIEWSYHLLDSSEQRLFRRISVFVGGCKLEVVEAVCAALDGEAVGVVDSVSSLIDKSLLQHIEQESQEPHLVMLETIREYALEALAKSGEIEDTRQAHAAYYLRLTEETEPELVGPFQTIWLERLEREHENLRAALQWSLEQAESKGDSGSQEMALRLSTALWLFWETRGYWSEGRRWLKAALALPGVEMQTAVRARALSAAGSLATLVGELPEAHLLLLESITLFKDVGDEIGFVHTLSIVGDMFLVKGDLDAAAYTLEECIALGRRLESNWELSRALISLGSVFYSKNDSTQARALTQEGLIRAREQGDRILIAMALNNLGYDYYLQGDLEQARTLTQEGLTLARELQDYPGVLTETLGTIALSQGDLEQATAYFTEGLSAAQEFGEEFISELLIAWHCIGLAKVAVAQNQLMRAARLFSTAEVRYDAYKEMFPFQCDDHILVQESVRARLGELAFEAARAEGRIMTIKQILAELEPVSMPESNKMLNTLTAIEKRSAIPTHPDNLTPREVEVLRLVAQGMTNEQVAEQLVISPRTVNTHLTSVYSKIQVSSRNAATRYAFEHHLV